MAKIKLVASDLDGTLLTSQKEITKRLKRTLSQIDALGIFFVPATGRSLQALPDCIQKLPSLRYVITSNGAVVYDMANKKKLSENLLAPEAVELVLDAIREEAVILEIICDGQGYIERHIYETIQEYPLTESHIRYLRQTRIPVEDIESFARAHQASIEDINLIICDDALRQTLWDKLKEKNFATITSHSNHNIEITAPTATKAHALQQLCEMLAIDAENVLAMGDGDNDIDMLYWAGESVAVANAPENVKAAANILTESCDEDGAAIVLDRVIAAMVLEQLLKRGE